MDNVGAVFGAWVCSLVFGLAVWPLVYFIFRRVPDRGLGFARILGMLVVGYLFWLAGIFHLWPNSTLSIWLAAILIGALGTWMSTFLAADRKEAVLEPWRWIRTHWKEALANEIVFLALFAWVAWLRANNPEALGTEKPMELAFIDAILRSAYFPANDPWLAGYSISYYHFGYILTAMVAKAIGLTGGVAFNVGSAFSYALAGAGAYALLRNLLCLWRPGTAPVPEGSSPWRKRVSLPLPKYVFLALLAPFTLLFLGNLEGGLEILHAQHVGWEDGNGYFWKWLDIQQLYDAPAADPQPAPTRWWWWWRASRVINDRSLTGEEIELIDEFPAFSMVLGDLHPHVLSMPYLIAALLLALEFLLRGGALPEEPRERWAVFLFAALLIGSLIFLNTWDFPVLWGITAAAALAGWMASRAEFRFGRWSGWAGFGAQWVTVALTAVALYIPFLLTFQSQAGGLLPNVLFPSRGVQFFVMFATLLIPVSAWVLWEVFKPVNRPRWKDGAWIAGTGLLVLIIGSLVSGYALSLSSQVQDAIGRYIGENSPMEAITLVLAKRMVDPLASLAPAMLAAGALAVVLGWVTGPRAAGPAIGGHEEDGEDGRAARTFAFILVVFGALLVVFPEYFYLRDLFGWRMNTVFKFYFQAWQYWSLAAAFAMAVLLRALSDGVDGIGRRSWILFGGVALGLAGFAIGAVYFPMAAWSKTGGYNPQGGQTLDASAYMAWSHPEDAAAIQWIRQNIDNEGPIVEAVGGQYSDFARIATHTGIPTVLGWAGHESQWRGGYKELGSREADIEELYLTEDWSVAEIILQQYKVRYVYYGLMERDRYPGNGLQKFLANLPAIYQAGEVYIFEFTPAGI